MEGDAAHHLGRVLRAQTGQLYELSDGEEVWLGRIDSVSRDRVQFALIEQLPVVHPSVNLTLLLAVVKFDAFEWAIEKATELGVNTIVPIAPEGGWTDEEFAAAGKSGFTEASLGRRLLRTETAVVTALASLNFALGDD